MVHPNSLDRQLDNYRTLQESYDQIAGAAEAYNTGKVELAQAITSKGVETSPTETYPEMAEKVNAISQETYEINGGEMYAKQLFGSLETPNYWNLYDVLAQLLSDGRLINYGGILLAEYYRSYDSLALSGAGSGGAYVVSDKDGDGNFIMYTEDTTHVWDAEFNGKGNRWVAYCFADEYHDFQITNTNTSPRSIFIGRKVGTITSLVNGRVSQIVVPDGNELRNFNSNTYTQNWDKKVIIRNLSSHETGNILYNATNVEALYLQFNEASGSAIISSPLSPGSSIIIESERITASIFGASYPCTSIILKGEYIHNSFSESPTMVYKSIKEFALIDVEDVSMDCRIDGEGSRQPVMRIYIGYKTNDKSKSVQFTSSADWGGFTLVYDVELKDGWCKPLDIHLCSGSTFTEDNIYAHVLQRLKQDEPDCGDGVTITLGRTNLAKLTSAESVQLLDDLTNIYGYTFA